MKKILIVDDEIEIADFLCNFLRRFGLQTEKAADGEEALETAERINPDWIFLDIKMPKTDGLKVLKELNTKKSQTNVIMITGLDDEESQKQAKKLGAKDYIVKPLDLEELHKKIDKNILSKKT